MTSRWYPQLPNKFETSQGYTRFCLKNPTNHPPTPIPPKTPWDWMENEKVGTWLLFLGVRKQHGHCSPIKPTDNVFLCPTYSLTYRTMKKLGINFLHILLFFFLNLGRKPPCDICSFPVRRGMLCRKKTPKAFAFLLYLLLLFKLVIEAHWSCRLQEEFSCSHNEMLH